MQPLSQKTSTSRMPHSIQLLALGPVPEAGQRHIKLTVANDAKHVPTLSDVYRGLRISE